jgi:hypothetical protein
MTIETELVSFKATRHRCPHCRRSFSSKTYAVKHIGRCQKRMANHACKTCAFFCDVEPPCSVSHDPGSPACCTEGLDLSNGLRTHCLSWEAIF